MNNQLTKKFYENGDDIGKFTLRFTIGFLMLINGIAKINGGIGFIEGMLIENGFPAIFAYGVYLGQVVAPIMLLIGFRVRFAAFVLMFTMIGSIYLAHMGEIFTLNEHGGWPIELNMFYILGALAIMFLGAGKYSIDKK